MTLKNRLIDLHNKIMGLPNFKLVVLMLILKIIVTAIVFPLFYIFPLEQSVYDSFDTSLVYQNAGIAQILYLVFNICIFVPLMETLLMQTLIIRVLMKIFKNKSKIYTIIIPILISALVFGIAHFAFYKSFVKVLQTFLIGTILSYTYVVSYLNGKKATLNTAALHGLFVFLIILFDYIVNFILK